MYAIRKLKEEDYHKGFLQTLTGLTQVGDINFETFKNQLKLVPDIYVMEHKNKIIASGTLYIEYKMIHSCGKVGHIEDIVVDPNYRGKGLGLMIVQHLVDLAKSQNCYKVILDCSEHNVPFYEKCGFKKKEVEMVQYFSN